MKRSPFIHGNINVGIYTYCKFHCYCISMHRFTQMAYGWRKDIKKNNYNYNTSHEILFFFFFFLNKNYNFFFFS